MTEFNFTRVLTAVAELTAPYSAPYSGDNSMTRFFRGSRAGAYAVISHGIQNQFGVGIAEADFRSVETVGRLATMVALELDPEQAVPQIVQAVINIRRLHPNQPVALDVALDSGVIKNGELFGTSGRELTLMNCVEYFGIAIDEQNPPDLETGNDIVRFVREGLLAAAR